MKRIFITTTIKKFMGKINSQKGFLQIPILIIISIIAAGTFIAGTVALKNSTNTKQPLTSQPSELQSKTFYIKTDGARARECHR